MNGIALTMFSMSRSTGVDVIRSLLSIIDGVVYYFVSAILQTIFDIATLPFDIKTLEDMASKFYVILSIFMFFKIAISLLGYLVNPDTLSDKQVGVGKLASRVIVSLLILLIMPFAFRELTDSELTKGILDTLPRLLISSNFEDGRKNLKSDPMATAGKNVAWSVLSGFVTNNLDCSDHGEGASREIVFEPFVHELGYNEFDAYGNRKPHTTLVLENINLSCSVNKNVYFYEYTPVVSTIAGVFLLYVLLGIAINVGIRMFKLMILRIIAPIPIISYIDPKSSKDGPFNKWLKSVGSTWAELYIHLGIIYFVIYLVQEVINKKDSAIMKHISGFNSTSREIYVVIFLILSLFFFAKKAPKFISDSLGLKSEGFGDIMKMAGSALGIGAAGIGIAGATVGAAAGNLGQTYKDLRNAKGVGGVLGALARGAWRAPGTAITGLGSGLSGAAAAFNADKGQFKAAMEARNKYITQRANGKNLFSDIAGAAQGFVGYDLDRDIAQQGKILSASKQLEDFAKSEGAKFFSDEQYRDSNGKGYALKDSQDRDWTLTSTRNQIYDAIQLARQTGSTIKLKDENGVEFDTGYGADSSFASKLTGDYDEFVGQYTLDHTNEISSDATKDTLDSYQQAYGRAIGTSHGTARRHTISQIKANRKKADANKNTLELKKNK